MVVGSSPGGANMLFPWTRYFTSLVPLDPGVSRELLVSVTILGLVWHGLWLHTLSDKLIVYEMIS